MHLIHLICSVHPKHFIHLIPLAEFLFFSSTSQNVTTSNVGINVTLRGIRETTAVVEEQSVLHILSACLQPWLSSKQKRMRRIKWSSVACPALPYFPPLCYKRHDFRERFTEHTKCVSTFSIIFVRNISHSKKNAER
jgi:hypothetical protein